MAREPDSESPGAGPCWLQVEGRIVALNRPEILIGRGGDCHITLDDPLVSRQHAKIVLHDGGAKVVDLGSSNGVFVNMERVEGTRGLSTGDVILVGQAELRFLRTEDPDSPAAGADGRLTPDTLKPVDPIAEPSKMAAERKAAVSTQRTNVFEVLGKLADRALTLNRPEDAERVLESQLTNVLGAARETLQIDPTVAETAATWAIKLAGATRKGEWVDYTFALYGYAKRPIPSALVDELESTLRRVKEIDLRVMTAYFDVLESELKSFGPEDRVLVQRIASLARIAAK